MEELIDKSLRKIPRIFWKYDCNNPLRQALYVLVHGGAGVSALCQPFVRQIALDGTTHRMSEKAKFVLFGGLFVCLNTFLKEGKWIYS